MDSLITLARLAVDALSAHAKGKEERVRLALEEMQRTIQGYQAWLSQKESRLEADIKAGLSGIKPKRQK